MGMLQYILTFYDRYLNYFKIWAVMNNTSATNVTWYFSAVGTGIFVGS
jgi:hypothetical protein